MPSSDVSIFKTNGYATLLLVRHPTNKKFYLFTINNFFGSISFDGIPMSSIFDKHEDAYRFIATHHVIDFESITTAQALIGIARYGPHMFILVVTEAKAIARIQNKHTIYQIQDVLFYPIEIPYQNQPSFKDSRRITRITEFPIAGYHFWCPTKDLSKPIVYDKREPAFVWNEYWAKPFAEYGMRNICIDMLQGTAITRIIDFGLEVYRFSLLTIRQAKHGGTRYYARGLDEEGYAANEVQSELIVESNSGALWSHVWRRGSVPVKWRSIVAKNLPTVTLYIENDCARYTPIYFDRLRRQFPENIFCLNLLHSNKGNSEYPLCEAYLNAVASLEKTTYIEFDWHATKKEKGIEATTNFLLSLIENPSITKSVPENTLQIGIKTESYNNDSVQMFFPNEKDLPEIGLEFQTKQSKVMRVNCMDSLDRTNVACFYYSAAIISHILKDAGVGTVVTNYEQLMNMPEQVRLFLAKAFIEVGDCVSCMYTNTVAAMKDNFSDVAQIENKGISDSQIAVQRRFQNFMNDKNRQKIVELFNGEGFHELLPSVDCNPSPKCVSDFPSIVMPPPLIVGNTMVDASVLLRHKPSYLVCSNSTSLLIMLNHYCYISHLVFIVAPPSPPTSISLYTSLTHGPKLPLVSKIAIPFVIEPTPVMICIPPEFSNHNEFYMRFLCIEFESSSPTISLSNIFIFGIKKQISNDKYYTEMFQPIDRSIVDDTFMGADTTPPDIILKHIKSFNYHTVIQLEISRLFHKMSRLDICSKLPFYRLDPLQYHLSKQRLPVNQIGMEQGKIEDCVVCTREGRWKCYKCGKSYCEGKCSQQHKIMERYYFADPVMICDVCAAELSKEANFVDTLLRLYKSFFKLYDPNESGTNDWLRRFDSRKLSTHLNPTQFPSAFFSTSDDPRTNMILTDEGGFVRSPQSLLLTLGATMKISKIKIESTDDCIVMIRAEGNNKKITIDASKSKEAVWEAEGRFFYVILKNGQLNKLNIIGIAQPPELFKCDYKFKTPQMPISYKTRVSEYNASSRLSTVENGLKPAKGITLKGVAGLRSMIIIFFGKDSRAPSETKYYIVPQGCDPFTLLFNDPISARVIQIKYYDVGPQFNEPKIELIN